MSVSVPYVLVKCDGGCGTRTSIDLVWGLNWELTESVATTLTKKGWDVGPSMLGQKDVMHLCPSCAPKILPTVADIIQSHEDPHHVPSWEEVGVDNVVDHIRALDAKKVRGTVKISRSRNAKRHAVIYYLFTDKGGRDHILDPTVVCNIMSVPTHRTIINGGDDMITCVKCRKELGLKDDDDE